VFYVSGLARKKHDNPVRVRLIHPFIMLYFVERLLFRLSISRYSEQLVLKGGLLLYLSFCLTCSPFTNYIPRNYCGMPPPKFSKTPRTGTTVRPSIILEKFLKRDVLKRSVLGRVILGVFCSAVKLLLTSSKLRYTTQCKHLGTTKVTESDVDNS